MNSVKKLSIVACTLIIMYHVSQAVCIPVTPSQRTNNYTSTHEQCAIEQVTDIALHVTTLDEAVIAVRIAPLLHAQGKQLHVYTDATLQPLVTMSPYSIVHDYTDQSPRFFNGYGVLEQLQEHCSPDHEYTYLNVDTDLTDLWHEAFAHHTSLRIGLCLERSYHFVASQLRSTDFVTCSLLKHIELFTFDAIKHLSTEHQGTLHYFHPHMAKDPRHIVAILNELDLLITSCPAMAALATMLKKPVWLLQHEGMDTRTYRTYYPEVEIISYSTDDKELVVGTVMQRLSSLQAKQDAIITTEVQIGELIDKMIILEIKTERIQDEKKLANVWRELTSVRATFEQHIPQSPELTTLMHELKEANEALWVTEDLIRDKEREKSFDDEFIRLARSVYIQNDRRCQAKRAINELLGSRLIEEKSYKAY